MSKFFPAAAAAKSLQSCPTLCDPIDGSPPGSPVPGILQARILEWVAFSFSNAWKWKVKVKSLSRVWLLATPWSAAHQAPPSMGFSRQEYWSGVPLPSLKFFISICEIKMQQDLCTDASCPDDSSKSHHPNGLNSLSINSYLKFFSVHPCIFLELLKISVVVLTSLWEAVICVCISGII